MRYFIALWLIFGFCYSAHAADQTVEIQGRKGGTVDVTDSKLEVTQTAPDMIDYALLTTSPATFTASWADVGGENSCGEYDVANIFMKGTVDTCTDMQFRIVVLHTTGGDEFTPLIRTVGTSSVAVEDHYYEMTDDADFAFVFRFDCFGSIPFWKLQIRATIGGSPGAVSVAGVNYNVR